ncbi:hypothetical protein [Sphingomonas faeni]|uniref:hypothetical protein n=1 Tax=Sphingomonas faeni TaxID=185950 RepID=UPI00277F10E9|nr:hypothetical protein [Sphingomonas faeni]MDQ0836631.1 hypothetical protein [Sphingomonas faeni]
MADYLDTRDRVIEVIGREFSAAGGGRWRIALVCARFHIELKSGWAHQIAKDMDELGLARNISSAEEAGVEPKGACVEWGRRVANERSILGRLKMISRPDRISIASLVVSIGALIVAIIALKKN